MYVYDFGDGRNQTIRGFSAASLVSHTYQRPGSYLVMVKATNVAGSGTAAVPITIYGELHSWTDKYKVYNRLICVIVEKIHM